MKKTSVSIGDKTFNIFPLSFTEINKLTLGGRKPFDWDMQSSAFLEFLHEIVINHSDVTEADLEAMTIDEVVSLYLRILEITYQIKTTR